MNLMFDWAAWPICFPFCMKEVNVTEKLPRGPAIDMHVDADRQKNKIHYIATCSMYKIYITISQTC